MVTSKGKRAKAVEINKKRLDYIEDSIGSKKLSDLVKNFINDIYHEIAESEINDNMFERSYYRKKLQLELYSDELNFIKDMINQENNNFDNLQKIHDEKISRYEKKYNENLKEYKDLEKSLMEDEKILRKNQLLKEDLIKKILLDYKNKNLDVDVLRYELNDSGYIFELSEFKEYYTKYLKDKLDSEICICSYKQLNNNNINENDVSDEYKLFITDEIIDFLDSLCKQLVKSEY